MNTELGSTNTEVGGSRLLALGLLSASILGFEVALTRVISITHWHHLAPVVIAIALLGFGAAGSLASIGARTLMRRAEAWAAGSAFALALLIPVAVMVSGRVPLDLPSLAWRSVQVLHLCLYNLVFLVPFLIGALYVTLALMRAPGSVSRIYGANLLGSALGAVAVLPGLNALGLESTILICALVAGLAGTVHLSKRAGRLGVAGLFAVLVIVTRVSGVIAVQSSPSKALSIRLQESGARVLWERDSYLSRLTLVQSLGLHAAPGLSLNTEEDPPRQWALFADGDEADALLSEWPSGEGVQALRQVLSAAPYLLRDRPTVLILGMGGGWDAWVANAGGAGAIDGVEPNPLSISLLEGEELPEEVHLPAQIHLVRDDPRHFVVGNPGTYDIIATRVVTSSVGVSAEKVTFGLTREAFSGYLDRLEPGGVLAISTQLDVFPQSVLRLAATSSAALSERGANPPDHVVLVRDWRNALLLVARDPFSTEDISWLRRWSEDMSFDLVALPGLAREETNRFHELPEPLYHDAVQELLHLDSSDFLDRYVFDVAPVTDNQPFFHRTFRPGTVRHLRNTLGRDWPRHVGWSYLLSIVALPLVGLIAGALILLPLIWIQGPGRREPSTTSRRGGEPVVIVVYFGCIGLGFMFLEIGLIDVSLLLLGAPTVAVAVVLASVLAGAGLGSLASRSRKLPDLGLLALTMAIGVLGVALVVLLQTQWAGVAVWPFGLRALASALPVAAVAFVMGFPFPQGIARISDRGPGVIAWALGINGFASVVGALSATLIAMHLGFRALAVCAGVAYLLAGLVGKRVGSSR
jgi:hypothetical protein